MKNILAMLKGYFLAGTQVEPFVKIVRCPKCNEPFFVKVSPFLGSRFLTIMLYYGVVYDMVDGHLREKHNWSLNIERSYFVRNRTTACLTRMFGKGAVS